MKRQFKQPATLIYVTKQGKVLLAEKIKKVNAGCFTGYGGKIEKGETEVDSAVRELKQESGIDVRPNSLKKIAIVNFFNSSTDAWRVHVFLTNEFIGKPISTDEMKNPKWFDVSNLPLDRMRETDKYWLPLVLIGIKFEADVYFKPFKIIFKKFK